jgi:hypothetical protein
MSTNTPLTSWVTSGPLVTEGSIFCGVQVASARKFGNLSAMLPNGGSNTRTEGVTKVAQIQATDAIRYCYKTSEGDVYYTRRLDTQNLGTNTVAFKMNDVDSFLSVYTDFDIA